MDNHRETIKLLTYCDDTKEKYRQVCEIDDGIREGWATNLQRTATPLGSGRFDC